MRLRQLFPRFDVKVNFLNSIKTYGEYWAKKDIILINREMIQQYPMCWKLVLIHEMMHSTGSNKRLMRRNRLEQNFGEYVQGSLSYAVEECIVEVATLVAGLKMGIINQYNQSVILSGLEKFYKPDMYIPIREVRAAVRYFADNSMNFEEEIEEAKSILEAYLDVKFQDTYNSKESA